MTLLGSTALFRPHLKSGSALWKCCLNMHCSDETKPWPWISHENAAASFCWSKSKHDTPWIIHLDALQFKSDNSILFTWELQGWFFQSKSKKFGYGTPLKCWVRCSAVVVTLPRRAQMSSWTPQFLPPPKIDGDKRVRVKGTNESIEQAYAFAGRFAGVPDADANYNNQSCGQWSETLCEGI